MGRLLPWGKHSGAGTARHGKHLTGGAPLGKSFEFQNLKVGDRIAWGREFLTVAAIEPNRALVLSYARHGMEWVWQFGLYPLDRERTRLVSRGTEHTPNTAMFWLFMRMMEPASFVMTTRMLVNVKKRAERLYASRSMAAQAA